MPEDTAEMLGISLEEFFKVACLSAFCPIPNLNPNSVHSVYKGTGYIPEFVVEFCRKAQQENQNGF